jgi:hypothetical protein
MSASFLKFLIKVYCDGGLVDRGFPLGTLILFRSSLDDQYGPAPDYAFLSTAARKMARVISRTRSSGKGRGFSLLFCSSFSNTAAVFSSL